MEEVQALEQQEIKQDPAAAEVGKEDQKYFSQTELEDIISKRLSREKKKMEEEAVKAKRLAEMSAEEKLKHEMQDQKERLEAFEKRAKQAELKDKASDHLRSYGVDTGLAKFLIGSDEETTLMNIKEFKHVWDLAIRSATDKALQGSTPAAPKIAQTEVDPLMKAFDKAGW